MFQGQSSMSDGCLRLSGKPVYRAYEPDGKQTWMLTWRVNARDDLSQPDCEYILACVYCYSVIGFTILKVNTNIFLLLFKKNTIQPGAAHIKTVV